MELYKIIVDGKIVGVSTSVALRKYQASHNILTSCVPEEAEYLETEEALYHAAWMRPIENEYYKATNARIPVISEGEYNELYEALTKDEPILFVEDVIPEEEPEEIELVSEEDTVAFVREAKLKELSLACRKAIMDGFDLTFGDEVKHFSLTMQDQSNLMSCQIQILSGAPEVPYHADGEGMIMYSADDMTRVIRAADEHKTYNLAYYNSAKRWVGALRKISNIKAVEYGSEIPKKYRTTLLESLL